MTWTQPGDPLYPFPGTFVRPLVQVIDTTDSWADAARWPDPVPHNDLDHCIVPGRAL